MRHWTGISGDVYTHATAQDFSTVTNGMA